MTKKILLIWCMIVMTVLTAGAQSMSDKQIINFVLKEQKAGTSQQQIVVKLMQRGVTIEQLQKVRKKYERSNKKTGLGTVKDDYSSDTEAPSDRLRRSNSREQGSIAKLKSEKLSSMRKFQNKKVSSTALYNEQDEELEQQTLIKSELDDMLPDSLDEYDREVIKKYIKWKEGYGSKRIFGHNIFNNEEMTFEPNMNIATPNDYVLGPGDYVYVDVYGASQKTFEETISPDGFVVIEDFGPVQVAGLTVAQANTRLRQQLGPRYSSSKVRLTVGQTRTVMVHVMGEVKKPGTYTLSAFSSVFHALYMAGGPNDIGTLRNIKVYRKNRLVSTVDVYDYMLNGKLSGNVRLGDNDVIVVGAYDCLVNISGKVKRPMYYEMKPNESLGTLINYAGGFTGDAYRKSIRVVRKSDNRYSVHNVNEFDINAFHMTDNDSVNVDSIIPRFSNMVEVKGAVFRPGMYQVGDNIHSIKTLIESAEGLTEEAFTQHAVMHRMKPDRTLEAISVDVEGIINGTVADITLQNEDVLFIPTRQQNQIQQTITIHGEVVYPGVYQYADNETLEDFVLQAGGLTETASLHNVLVSRRIVDPNALKSDSVLAQTFNFSLKDGFVIEGEQSFRLQPFDEVYVRRSPNYFEQQNVTVDGEVQFQGTYTLIKKNERLSDLFRRAGGATDLGYIEGARLIRRVNAAERARLEEIARMRKTELERLMEEMAINNGMSVNEATSTSRMNNVTAIPDTYPVGIELDKALAHPGSDADIVLREGDYLFIPPYNGTVKINGEVMYPNSVAYTHGKSPSYYLKQAGGINRYGKKKYAYIIYMNGTVAKLNDGAKVRPGCEIVVPSKAIHRRMTPSEYFALGTSAASVGTMFATVASLLKNK